MSSTVQHQSILQVRASVARVLLEHAGDVTGGRGRLAKRDIADITGAGWGLVHISLQSLQEEGAIRIERNRLIINRELLRKVAEYAMAD